MLATARMYVVCSIIIETREAETLALRSVSCHDAQEFALFFLDVTLRVVGLIWEAMN